MKYQLADGISTVMIVVDSEHQILNIFGNL